MTSVRTPISIWDSPRRTSPIFPAPLPPTTTSIPSSISIRCRTRCPIPWAAGANCRFSQVYYGLDRLAPAPGETLLIQGAGSMGLYAAAIARELGVVTIVIDSVAERLEMAKRFGADHLINMTEYPTLSDREQAVRDLTGGRGADMALEVTGVASAVEEGLHHLAPMGRYVIIGTNVLSAQATLSPGYITRKSLMVTGVAAICRNTCTSLWYFWTVSRTSIPLTHSPPSLSPWISWRTACRWWRTAKSFGRSSSRKPERLRP